MQSPPFSFSGVVQRNLGRGRELGFPTANITISSALPEGLFLGYTTVTGRILPSLIFIGSNVTFGETEKKAEVYILDFNEDIYGETIAVDVQKKLRDTVKFESAEKLIEQMKQDELEARKFF